MRKVFTLLFLLVSGFVFGKSHLQPGYLRCAAAVEPPAVEVEDVRFSWINEPASADLKGVRQTAWQVLVATTPERLREGSADLWNSGRVEGDASHLVPYQGMELPYGERVYWKVRTWDEQGKPSDFSEVASFGVAVRRWKAAWIGAPWFDEEGGNASLPAPEFRKVFRVNGKVRSARVHVAGLGFFELRLNGRKVGEDCYVPGFTDWSARPRLASAKIPLPARFRGYRTLYMTYDLPLRRGKNTLSVLVGNGFYNPDHRSGKLVGYASPRMILRLDITYADGRKEQILSNPSWEVRCSGTVRNEIYQGETYDARAVGPWEQAVPRKAPDGPLTAVPFPADRVAERLLPVSREKLPDGSWKLDFGRTVTGRVAFSELKGAAGDTVCVRFLSEEKQGKERYILKGRGRESWAPRFCWFVFRECIVSGPAGLEKAEIWAEDIHADLRENASFSVSDSLLQQIQTVFCRTQLQNTHCGYASDCPHREKLPYTGDGQVAMPAVLGHFDAETFYGKWMTDIRLAQDTVDGYVPNGAPWEPHCGGGTAWGSAICIMPWSFYLRYGDVRVLQDNRDAMQAYVDYLLTWRRPDGTVCQQRAKAPGEPPFRWYNLGDWCAPGPLPPDALVHTFYAWYCADILARTDAVLMRSSEARAVADSLAEAFHRVFYNEQTGSYGPAGSNVFALRMGVPEERLARVLEALQAELAGGHLTTGIFATRFLPEVLAENGLSDLAYTVLTQKGFPGFEHMFAQGADTLWEQWDGKNSHNHPMFGGCLSWYYTTLSGIRFDEWAPGGRHLTVKPILPSSVDHVHYATQTPYGTVCSEVWQSDGRVRMAVTLPVGCSADVYLPASPAAFQSPSNPANWVVYSLAQGQYTLE